jgi:hypothetical protein
MEAYVLEKKKEANTYLDNFRITYIEITKIFEFLN